LRCEEAFDVLRWVGSPLAVAGALTLLLALLLFVAGELGLAFGWWEPSNPAVERALMDAGSATKAELWVPMLWQGGLLLLAGLAFWALSFAATVGPQPERRIPPSVPPAGPEPAEDVPVSEAEEVTAGDVAVPDGAEPETDAVEPSEAEQELVDDLPAPEGDRVTAGDVGVADAVSQEPEGVEASEAGQEMADDIPASEEEQRAAGDVDA
jgi:hypothetical protein